MRTRPTQVILRIAFPLTLITMLSCDSFKDDSIVPEKQVEFSQTEFFILPGSAVVIDLNSVIKKSFTVASLQVSVSPSRGELFSLDTFLLKYVPGIEFQKGKDEFTVSVLKDGVTMQTQTMTVSMMQESNIANRLKVFGGLLYFQREQTIGYTEKQVEYTTLTPGDGEVIVEPHFRYVHKTFDYKLQNLGVQVGLNYQLAKGKFLQTAGTGIEFHFALNKFHQPSQAPEFTNNPSVYVFYNLYYRVQYPAEGKLRAVFQPTLNYSFYINQNLNAPFYVKPYGLGLNVGFTYNF